MFWASLVAQLVKNLPAMQEIQVWSLGREDPLEKGMATHSRILAGKSYGQRSLAGYSPWGHKELDMTEWLTLSLSRWFWTKLSIKIWEGLFKAFFFLCSLSLFVPLWLNLWLNLFSGLDWWSGSSPSKNSQRFCIC